jgi:TetR/AcrR family transcriptional regulator, fatty acid metabolism regulator protein
MNQPTQPTPKEIRRRTILDSAVRVFAEHGFADARIRDIAAGAGVAEGTIYLYFEGKEDLLLTAFREVVNDFCTSIRSVLSSELPFLERIERFIRLQFERIEAEPALAAVLLLESRQTTTFYSGAVRDVLRTYANAIDELLASGLADGVIRPNADLALARRMLIGALEEVELEWLIGDRTRPLAPSAELLADLFYRGLAPAPRTDPLADPRTE